MRDLAAGERETVNVYVVRDIVRVCIAQQESPQPLRHVVHVGDELPLWAGASAKVLLRNAPARAARPGVARPSPVRRGALAPHAGVDRRGGRAGFAVSHGEREEGLSAVAVPILGRSGTVVAALTLSGPTLRFTDDRVAEFATDLTEAARRA